MTSLPTPAEIAAQILDLCQNRGPEKTICPSEVARSLATVDLDWRDLMDTVRQAAGRLVEEGLIEVCRKGRVVDIDKAKGPIRLRYVSGQDE